MYGIFEFSGKSNRFRTNIIEYRLSKIFLANFFWNKLARVIIAPHKIEYWGVTRTSRLNPNSFFTVFV